MMDDDSVSSYFKEFIKYIYQCFYEDSDSQRSNEKELCNGFLNLPYCPSLSSLCFSSSFLVVLESLSPSQQFQNLKYILKIYIVLRCKGKDSVLQRCWKTNMARAYYSLANVTASKAGPQERISPPRPRPLAYKVS